MDIVKKLEVINNSSRELLKLGESGLLLIINA